MRIHYVLLLYVLFAAALSTAFGEGTLHTFTTPDGRSLNASILDYNARTGKIQIKREDGKKMWTLSTVFSEPDQEYVRQWIAADQFMSPVKFKIEAASNKGEKITKSDTINGDEVILGESVDIVYEITLENKTDLPIKDLEIEYRAFILGRGYEGREDSKRVGGGQTSIPEIPAGKKKSQKLGSITLVTRYETISEYDYTAASRTTYGKKTNQEQLKGFWIKVYGPEIDGTRAVREWCYPSGTMEDFEWQDNI